MPLRYKILGTYALVFILFVGLVISNVQKMRSIGVHLQVVEEGYIPMVAAVNSVSRLYHLSDEFNASTIKNNLSNSALLENLRSNYPKMIRESLDGVEHYLRSGNLTSGASPQVVAMLTGVKRAQGEHIKYQEVLSACLMELAGNPANPIPACLSLPGQREVLKSALHTLLGRVHQAIQQQITAVANLERQGAWFTISFSIAAAMLVLLLAGLVLLILRPIQQLTLGSQRISQGDYSQRVEIRSKDEVGILAREFNQMADSIASRNRELQEMSIFNGHIIDSMRTGLLVVDRQKKIVLGNRRMRQLFDLGDDRLGSSLSALPLEHLSLVDAKVIEVLQTKAASAPLSLVRSLGKGSSQLFEIRCLPLVGALDELTGVIILFEDVTDETLLRERLLQSEKLAVVGELSSQITHEIRNPLNALSLNLEMLQEDLAPQLKGEAPTLLARIAAEVKRLNQVAERYLRFVHPGGHAEQEVSLNAIAEEVMFLMQEQAQRQGCQIHTGLTENLPAVWASADTLKQGVVNLVKNAMEALVDGGGTIQVRTRVAGNLVVLEVEDNGPGVPAHLLPTVFDAFVTTKEKGTGLGLALTKKLVEEQHGQLSYRQATPHGAIFALSFAARNAKKGMVSKAHERNLDS